MPQLDFIGIGALNYDHLYVVTKIVIDGEQPIKKYLTQSGGSAANTIVALSKLGMQCGFIGAIGTDDAGKRLLNDLEVFGVATEKIAIKKRKYTGYTICLTDQNNKRSIYVASGANKLLNINDIDMEYLKLADFIHLTSFVDNMQFDTQLRILDLISSKARISFSPGMLYAVKGIKMLKPILEKTHILFVNRNEIEILSRKDAYYGAYECIEIGCKYVVVTDSKGYIRNGEYIVCNIFSSQKHYEISMPKTCIINNAETTGAGDSFAAGFLYGLINNMNIEKCAQIGHILAMFTIQNMGARKGLPDFNMLASKYLAITGKYLKP